MAYTLKLIKTVLKEVKQLEKEYGNQKGKRKLIAQKINGKWGISRRLLYVWMHDFGISVREYNRPTR